MFILTKLVKTFPSLLVILFGMEMVAGGYIAGSHTQIQDFFYSQGIVFLIFGALLVFAYGFASEYTIISWRREKEIAEIRKQHK